MPRIRMRASLAPIAALALLAAAPAAHAAGGCSRYAAPTGSDAAPGTEAAPFATAQRLADSLAPGETGCLHEGTYTQDVKVSQGGAPGAPVTLQSYPGERATLVGRLWIARGADFVTISDMDINGKNASLLPSPTVNAADTTFDHVDVTNDHTEICFELGSDTWGRAVRTVIQSSRIHDCGKLPSSNQDHAIYLSASNDVVIRGNVIYGNVDRGIQLYPDAQHTTVTGNVIDGNGEGVIFSGAGGVASSDNVVANNVITYSQIRSNVESWYPSGNPIGTGNVVTGNCVYGRDGGADIADSAAYTATANVVGEPRYVDRAAHDYRLQADSPCAGTLGDRLDPSVAAGRLVAGATVAGASTPTSSADSTAASASSPAPAADSGDAGTASSKPESAKAKGRSNPRYKLRAHAAVIRKHKRPASCRRARSSSHRSKARARSARHSTSAHRSPRKVRCR